MLIIAELILPELWICLRWEVMARLRHTCLGGCTFSG